MEIGFIIAVTLILCAVSERRSERRLEKTKDKRLRALGRTLK